MQDKMTMYDVDATELIEELAKELKKLEYVSPPKWSIFVKTGVHKERPPAREDWWYIRAASILRKIAMKGPIGVSKLRTLYGGKQSRGYASEKYKKGSGSIIRKVIQQLQKAELVKEAKKGVHKGRIITPKGIKLIDSAAEKVSGRRLAEQEIINEKKAEKPIGHKEAKKEEKPEPKKEEKQEAKKEEKQEVKGHKKSEKPEEHDHKKEVPNEEALTEKNE